MPRKKKSKVYFGSDVQDAIIRYNLSEDYGEKNKIYEMEIHKKIIIFNIILSPK